MWSRTVHIIEGDTKKDFTTFFKRIEIYSEDS